VLGEWLAGAFPHLEGRPLAEDDLRDLFGHDLDWYRVVEKPFSVWLEGAKGEELQAETPLTRHDLDFLREGPSDPLELAWAIIERKQPRWLMPETKIPLINIYLTTEPRRVAALSASLCSIPYDYAARQKIGGTTLNFFIFKQLPVLPPSSFTAADLDFITPPVLELTYTSHAMRLWAEDLGHNRPPFAWDEERRAQLRAEVDAFFAIKYGLTREELVYVLDPAKAKGPDYPSETFRVLQKNEIARYGEYRTERLVLAAFDRLTGAGGQ
jgi:hypothetical protein